MDLWLPQLNGINKIRDAIDAGEKRILLTLPTGGGKTRIMSELIEEYSGMGQNVVLYTNRKLILEQTSKVLAKAGHEHGIRAAGHDDERERNVQVSSIQTEHSRVVKKKSWELHNAQLVIIDEAHNNAGEAAKKIINAHYEAGAAIVGFTATPLDLEELYSCLIVAGTTSDCRACGALVPCNHYGPDEPDLKDIGKKTLGEDLSENEARKVMGSAANGGDAKLHSLFGRVLEWFGKLNPDRKPTILFAPGVAESIWFAEQFTKSGISAAHIDGKEIWFDGQLYRTDQERREKILEASRDGRVKVVCNRFVLREGVDAPWLSHGIFATVFGSLQSYLQSGGRLLRANPGKQAVTLQDHGGNWWRHGSLNADRQWELDLTPGIVAGLRERAMREKRLTEPLMCPQCARILNGPNCPCGYVIDLKRKSRPVVQTDGTLKQMVGDIFKPRRLTTRKDAPQIWERMYYRARSEKWNATFAQAEAMFAAENNWQWPPHTLPLMPIDPSDWLRKVREVPRERLIPK